MFTINLEDGREAPSQARKKGAKRLEFLVTYISLERISLSNVMYKSLINMNHAYENFFDSLNLEMLLPKKVPMLYKEETMNNIF